MIETLYSYLDIKDIPKDILQGIIIPWMEMNGVKYFFNKHLPYKCHQKYTLCNDFPLDTDLFDRM